MAVNKTEHATPGQLNLHLKLDFIFFFVSLLCRNFVAVITLLLFRKCDDAGIPFVTHEWFVDSLIQQKVQKFDFRSYKKFPKAKRRN
jgi:hypothetical protein